MMVMWSQHTGADDAGGVGVTSYMSDSVVWKPKAGGGRERLQRVPPPEVLRGDAAIMRQAISAVDFQRKYSSGVLSFERDDIDVAAFNAGDRALRDRVDQVIQSFEDTAFAGIRPEHRPPTFWTTHTHCGRLELNFVAPRQLIAGDGRVRSINPHPPTPESRKLYDAWRDSWNAKNGWADPEDPARAQPVKIPNWISKLAAEAGRAGAEPPKHFARTAAQWVEAAIGRGEVSSREDLIAQLKEGGVKIPRVGTNYITLENADGKRFRLRGRAFCEDFTSLAALRPGDHLPPRLDLAECEQRLEQHVARRAEFHQKRYGGPAWLPPAIEPGGELPSMLPLEPATQTYRRRPKATSVTDVDRESIEPRPEVGRIEAEEEDEERRRRYKQRLWTLLFGAGLPSDLLIIIRFIDQNSRAVTLADGAVVTDHGDRISTTSASEDAVRLMVAEAMQKNWRRLSANGSDAFKALVAAEIVRTGGDFALNDEIQHLVNIERSKKHVQPNANGARVAEVGGTHAGRSGAARAAAGGADRRLDRASQELGRSSRDLADAAAELARLKQEIDLRVVAEMLGFVEDLKAGDRRHTVMRHMDGTKLIIGVAAKSGDWAFSSNVGQQGTVIDLLKWREGLSIGQSRGKLRSWLRSGQERSYARRPKPAPAPPDAARAISEWAVATESYRSVFLEESRRILPEVLASNRFAGTFRVDDRHNVVFPYFSGGDLVGVERRNRPPVGSDRSFRAYSEGGRPGIWTSAASADDIRLVIVESPIDAMAHFQCQHPNARAVTRYAAIRAGCSEDDIRRVIAEMPSGTEVVAACDADAQGEVYNELVRRLTPADRGFEIDLPRDGGKDWNQMLLRDRLDPERGEQYRWAPAPRR